MGSGNAVMNISLFGKVTAAVIILTAFTFLAIFSAGVPATPKLMAPWSAVAFVIVGCTLWIASNPLAERFGLHRIGAILVFAIGAIVCVEHLIPLASTAFDRLLFPTLLPRNSLLPGRPAQLA